ncbi:uncharacterized protein LOC122059340 isoform X1 [Macadamia integrifolia]|uniref:uncharacterized protein LOC122059340 isoform X1 n=1 Tax=Macadamia integrifolia TaxID=60698 RepID=UPI001C52B3F4|nr:uncharacterized protein LOC122059340 isoform X1 [Macadamia integrifolia]
MAARVSISASQAPIPSFQRPTNPPSSSSASLRPLSATPLHSPEPIPNRRKLVLQRFKIHANIGGGGEGDVKQVGGRKKKKFITREEEPEQYWQTAGEREGENPMKTPLPYIIIFGMSTPFVILAIAFANGWIKVPVR